MEVSTLTNKKNGQHEQVGTIRFDVPAIDRRHVRADVVSRYLFTPLEDADNNQLIIEATTSWACVGAGLRIQLESLGPEYSMELSLIHI